MQTIGLWIGAATLTGWVLATPVQAQQPYTVADADVDIWITDIWEHKVTLTIRWQRPAGVCKSDRLNADDCPLSRRIFRPINMSRITDERADSEAKTACDYYKRQAVGPLNVFRMNDDRWEFQYTYACAIR